MVGSPVTNVELLDKCFSISSQNVFLHEEYNPHKYNINKVHTLTKTAL